MLDWFPKRLVSGGQTGVDRAALDAAIADDIAHGGWCPAGRRAEDGAIPPRYALTEAASRSYALRTRLNVHNSDATLILNEGELEGGSALTLSIARRIGMPNLVVDLDRDAPERCAATIVGWLRECRPAVLNVPGPRESRRPGIGARARRVVELCVATGRGDVD